MLGARQEPRRGRDVQQRQRHLLGQDGTLTEGRMSIKEIGWGSQHGCSHGAIVMQRLDEVQDAVTVAAVSIVAAPPCFGQVDVAARSSCHDIGVWSDKIAGDKPNIDYIDPSVARAVIWLEANKKPESWLEPVKLMISEHHKLGAYHGATNELQQLVETFRQADLVDFSIGLVRNGLSRALVRSVIEHWPNAGFHAGLMAVTIDRFKTHPFNPFPMMKL